MASRLLILTCAREMALVMEDAKVDEYVIREWMRQIAEEVCRPSPTVSAVTLIELRVSQLFHNAAVWLKDAEADES